MKIYKIVSEHSTKCYVGKTIQTLSRRFRNHRSAYNRWWEMKDNWCSAIGLLMLGDCSIELLEETEDIQAERKWIAQLDCVNNLRLQFGDGNCCPVKQKEWFQAHREQLSAYQKERVICERCGTETSKGDVRRHQRSFKCKDTAAGKVLNLKAKRCICELCGTEYADGHRHRHQRTKKCQRIYDAKCAK